MTKYEKALLDLLAYTEGTLGVSNNGYDVAVGFHLIIGWTENTNIVHGQSDWYNKATNSTAAGRYQFLGSTWTGSWIGGTKTKKGQNVAMTKSNQDIAALFLINRALKRTGIDSRSVTTGELGNRTKFNIALQKIASTWASIPLTKDVTVNGTKHFAGSSYYSSDGVNKSRHTPSSLWKVYNQALALYS